MFNFFYKKFPNLYNNLSFDFFYYIYANIYKFFFKQSDLLLYLGPNNGHGLVRIFYKFKRVIAIEANTLLCAKLRKNFKSKIEIYNYALGNKNGFINLNIYEYDSTNATIDKLKNKKIIKKFKVRMVKLGDFLKKKKINKISFYLSDIEGLDYTVLKSIEFMILEKKIKFIQHECTVSKFKNPYIKFKNNEKLFYKILKKNYKKIATGFGILKPGVYDINKNYRFRDILWQLKDK